MQDLPENRRRCVDCAAVSARTETNYTLISSQHGWRVVLRNDEHGQRVTEWRCPRCWAKHKRKAG